MLYNITIILIVENRIVFHEFIEDLCFVLKSDSRKVKLHPALLAYSLQKISVLSFVPSALQLNRSYVHTIHYLHLLCVRSKNNNILGKIYSSDLTSIRGRFFGKRRVFVRRYERVAAETFALNPITTLL